MKKTSLYLGITYVFLFLLLPAGLILLTDYLLLLDLSISPLIIVAAALIPIMITFRVQQDIDLKLTESSKPKRALLLVILPIILILLYPVYDFIVHSLLGTSPLDMLLGVFEIPYPEIGMTPILEADEDTIFIVFLNVFQFMAIIISFLVSHIINGVSDTLSSKPTKKESQAIEMLNIIQNTDRISSRKHNHRKDMRDVELTTKPKTVLILGLFSALIIPGIGLFMTVFMLSKGWGFLMFLSLILCLLILVWSIKRLIIRMNVYPSIVRFLFLIIIPGLIAYVMFQSSDHFVITAFGTYLDQFFTDLFNISADADPLASGEALVYFLGIGNALIALIGLYAFFTKCPTCHHWYDPYKLIKSTGTVGTYRHDTHYYHATGRVTKVYDSGDIDVAVDLNKTKTETDLFNVEIHLYECLHCSRLERKKLIEKS